MDVHVERVGVYAAIFAALLVLTGVTTAVAFTNLGPWNDVVMLVIAVTKAMLVVQFFMHMRHERPLTRIVAASGIWWLALLLALTLADVLTRPRIAGLDARPPYPSSAVQPAGKP
jgi:cytochrome c oxidase subunit 4